MNGWAAVLGLLAVQAGMEGRAGLVMQKGFPLFLAIAVLCYSGVTLEREKVWQDLKSLWMDNVKRYLNREGHISNWWITTGISESSARYRRSMGPLLRRFERPTSAIARQAKGSQRGHNTTWNCFKNPWFGWERVFWDHSNRQALLDLVLLLRFFA